MSNVSTAPHATDAPATPNSAIAKPLRIVLFGMPAAGKSSLLGALGQAAQSQEHLLNGRLTDLSEGLKELRQRLYDESPRRTVEEIVSYPVTFEPFEAEERKARGRRLQVRLIDCDGRVANDLLVRRKTIEPASPDGTLAQAVISADTLVLVIDASAPPQQVEADFTEFSRFLRLLERNRGQQAEIGGLPVYLVLTKCDLLARPEDDALAWMEQVEERKKHVNQRFQNFLAKRAAESGAQPFGRIDLRLWATAVKRPALKDTPARPREPHGIAELFRQCLRASADYRKRRTSSSWRLVSTLVGAAAVVALLVAAVVWIVGNTKKSDPNLRVLENEIARYEAEEGGTHAERLSSERTLRGNIAVLKELQNNKLFDQLSSERQAYVSGRLEEMEKYLAYLKKLSTLQTPTLAKDLAELSDLEATLQTDLVLPREEWAQTTAAAERKRRLKEITDLRDAVRAGADWYRHLREEGDALWAFDRRQPDVKGTSIDWPSWHEDVRGLFSKSATALTEHLPQGTPPAWGDVVTAFATVREARNDWQRTRQRLERLLDLSAALGMAKASERPSVLDINPSSVSQADFRTRLGQLATTYPNYKTEFQLKDLPVAAVGDIRQAARRNYEEILVPGRDWILARLQQAGEGTKETFARWQKVRDVLQRGANEFSDWRVLAQVLKRLHDPDVAQPDPVTDLISFLGKERFDIRINILRVRIPWDLRVTPAGDLTVYRQTKDGIVSLTLKAFGDPVDDAQERTKTYSFRATEDGSFLYEPGEALWAELPLRKERDSWMFTWARGRSVVFAFDKLTRGAFLHRANRNVTTGDYDEQLRLTPGGETKIPQVPDLVPIVKLK